ncbi:ABC transporter ATP-binding protein [Azospirillum doebereinerae]
MDKLSLTNVSKVYGGTVALSAVDLTVKEGEFVTLLGPSGSGKSTLLKIIAGMITSSTGRVVINGRDATTMPARERDLGMVFQNYALMPHMTVFENIAFPLRVRKRKEEDIRARVGRALDTVRLGHLAERKPAALSGGQQQRVAIARAIVYDPSLVLMDEPLGALDKKLREQLQVEIKQLHTELGITIVYVTHDQQEAMAMSDRVVLMSQGAIEQLGTPREMYFHPRTVFAADFLGESNFLDAVAEGAGADAGFRLGTGERVAAPRGTGGAVGRKVRLMVRPEHLSVVQEPEGLASGATLNRIKATGIDATFLGGATRYRLRLGNQDDVVVMGTNLHDHMGFEPGRPVEIVWNPENTVVFAQ